jgi:hypothetical protein
MKKICVVGAFGFSDLKATTGGQPVKTRERYYALKERYGDRVQFVIVNLTDGYNDTFASAMKVVEENQYTFPVFFDTDSGKIYAEARLDMGYTTEADGETIKDRNYVIDGKKVTGYMYILVSETEYYIAGANGAADTILIKVGDKYYTKYVAEGSTENVEYTVTQGVTVSERTKKVHATQEEAKIVDLQQGQAHKVSTLVYLDGNIADNSMVPAEGDLIGTMNLQFSSSADLKPMENGALHTPGTTNP